MKNALIKTFAAVLTVIALPVMAQITPESQMEKLDRGLVVTQQTSARKLVSWRWLGTDDPSTTFDVLKNGEVIASDLTRTNYRVTDALKTNRYQVVVKVNGVETGRTPEVTPWSDFYLPLKLDRPASGVNADGAYSYVPCDCSVGDVDGDGQYEIIVKWDPTNSKDNSQSGITGNVNLDCYRLDGEKLWRVDLGPNIRAGAHYTQFMVYDFDLDGKAELMCKTAPGSIDGVGNYVNQAATDARIQGASNSKSWVVSGGRINGGHEYLTVFNGETGAAIHTIAYNPNRNANSALSESEGTFNWGTGGKNDRGSYGNRGERYLAAVAWLDGPDGRPSGIFCRGYYTYAYVWAVDFDGRELKQKWYHASSSTSAYSVTDSGGNTKTYTTAQPTGRSTGSRTLFGNGNHNLSVGDVDGDGCDEIVWGSATLNNDGKLLFSTGFGHGDAIHLADHDPDRPGLELFQVHEESPYGWDLHDAGTGEVLFSATGSSDNGRGMAADLIPYARGSEFWSGNGRNPYSCQTGKNVSGISPSMNFRIYYDGSIYDQLLDGTNISKYQNGEMVAVYPTGSKTFGSFNGSASCNGTKATPCLSADILGDWREEVIFWSKTDSCTLNIFSTGYETEYRVPTLMHDHTYRMGICWQNTAYNQPPHLGYYLPDYVNGEGIFSAIRQVDAVERDEVVAVYDLQGRRVNGGTLLFAGEDARVPGWEARAPKPHGLYIRVMKSGRVVKGY